ncbi:Putative uncharacterized protein OS=Mesorhizobium alhagi CCNWXJ12-2 GN=MAXJ12_25733 PE=4 SV=1: PDDEXK_1 [Gemmataceae bacterium]|nr:Putative uncharacterized protein OS=Mesorhizobium alhagi CCNWXJ12-2 GN=MAXJ12_25733 PE=4 SV=1: PDDEXK_1 [Gemmataceae bacterium]VTT98804.1 Putative uncharacterized protein OS=Mesorhizobium alhagi CCNWXJ12-2 GN=MAXJ12_25733 PE=4 SV=1: PDDEXK_1 [Gemmataceae bacterium]
MFALPLIPSTSPTLAESMRSCLLRAGLSRLPGAGAYVLSNPRAWLGTAYHKVLERVPALARAGAEAAQLLDALWQAEITRLQQHAAAHALNARFGQPQYWRGYHLVLATVRLRAAELTPLIDTSSPPAHAPAGTHREDELTSFDGKLKGKPDLSRENEVIDFKTGSIYESEELDSSPVLRQAYVRQLQLYAYLLHDASGEWPARGRLYPIAGPPVEVNLNPADCTTAAQEAVLLLDRYNGLAASANDPTALASPSPDTCCWCSYKMLCPAFWGSADQAWAGRQDGEAARGALATAPRLVNAGTAYALTIAVEGGTLPHEAVSLTSLPAAVHTAVGGLAANDSVRIVGLRRRSDGVYYATERTVILPESQIPTITRAATGPA